MKKASPTNIIKSGSLLTGKSKKGHSCINKILLASTFLSIMIQPIQSLGNGNNDKKGKTFVGTVSQILNAGARAVVGNKAKVRINNKNTEQISDQSFEKNRQEKIKQCKKQINAIQKQQKKNKRNYNADNDIDITKIKRNL